MLITLAHAIGTLGMAGGQAIDLGAVGRTLGATELELMHRRKTGALIAASVELGALTAGVFEGETARALRHYGDELGLAFQIQDDILDVTGDTQTMGKLQGADAKLGKPNFPSIVGLQASIDAAKKRRDLALEAVSGLGERAALLRELAYFVVDRAH
jgi:geranylgeranyl pyrophosphate synthase